MGAGSEGTRTACEGMLSRRNKLLDKPIFSYQTAEDRYSNELVAHAESIKTIETLRKDLSVAQSVARDNSTAAETAQAKLEASESSWKLQKEALDKEISDLNNRQVLLYRLDVQCSSCTLPTGTRICQLRITSFISILSPSVCKLHASDRQPAQHPKHKQRVMATRM